MSGLAGTSQAVTDRILETVLSSTRHGVAGRGRPLSGWRTSTPTTFTPVGLSSTSPAQAAPATRRLPSVAAIGSIIPFLQYQDIVHIKTSNSKDVVNIALG